MAIPVYFIGRLYLLISVSMATEKKPLREVSILVETAYNKDRFEDIATP
jgi:hypothetical protein